MITIPIKIDRKDKEIMIKLLDSAKDYYVDFSNFDTVIGYEIYTEIMSKLCASQYNNKAIRLSLVQTKVFLTFLNIYAKIGNYEMANAHILTEKINKEINKKVITLIK